MQSAGSSLLAYFGTADYAAVRRTVRWAVRYDIQQFIGRMAPGHLIALSHALARYLAILFRYRPLRYILLFRNRRTRTRTLIGSFGDYCSAIELSPYEDFPYSAQNYPIYGRHRYVGYGTSSVMFCIKHRQESNHLVQGIKPLCTPRATTVRLNWHSRTRTYDFLINSQAFHQLNYAP